MELMKTGVGKVSFHQASVPSESVLDIELLKIILRLIKILSNKQVISYNLSNKPS